MWRQTHERVNSLGVSAGFCYVLSMWLCADIFLRWAENFDLWSFLIFISYLKEQCASVSPQKALNVFTQYFNAHSEFDREQKDLKVIAE